MAEQLPFDYALPVSSGFIKGQANQHILNALQRPHWPSGRLAVIGEAYSGKSTIAQSLLDAGALAIAPDQEAIENATQSSLIIIDNLDVFLRQDDAQELLFHLLNQSAAHSQKLVVFARNPLTELPITLPDLRSRMGTFEQYSIGLPDDFMVSQLFAKGFEERGVIVKDDVIDYLALRIDRSYETIFQAIEALDQSAMRDKGKINKKRVRDYLSELDTSISNA